MIFTYKGIDSKGNRIKSEIEASTLEEAKERLKSQGILYEVIEEDIPSVFDHTLFSRKYRVSAKELSNLSRELAIYIRAGISVVNALKVMGKHYQHHKKMHLFLQTISTYLDEGKNLYTALVSQSIVVLPEFYKHSIKVSESSGILDEVLLELSRFLQEQDRVSKEVRRAFAYPSFMIAISLLMVGFMLAFIVPQITAIFVHMDQELPVVTQFVISTGEFFNQNYILLLGGILSLIAAFTVLMQYNRKFRYAMHSLLLKTPVFGRIVLKSELGRFAYIGSLLIRSGVPFVQTIQMSSNILNNSVLQHIFLNAAKKVVEGKRLSDALVESEKIIDPAFVQAIALGEETSQVELVLVNISELNFEENKDKIALLLSLLEPLLMLFVGGIIGFIVAAMLLPVFSMSIG
jgi:general secretion pathway protein F/type IV pilus assembly protein PilC